MSRGTCAACDRAIDESAKLCPYCGANPTTGEKSLDTQSVLQEVFQPRDLSTSESVLEYAKQRQGAVIAISLFVLFLVVAALHQFVTIRNSTAVSDAPAVPLSEVADVTRRADEAAPVPMPKLDFQYDGKPQSMQTYIVEPGAVPPPEVVAAQQAAAMAKAPVPGTALAARPVAAPPRPGIVPQPRPQQQPQQRPVPQAQRPR
jgi:hypothetical protein